MNGLTFNIFTTPNQPPGKLANVAVHFHLEPPIRECLRQLAASIAEQAPKDVWLADALREVIDIVAFLDGLQITEFAVWHAPDNPARRYITLPSRKSETGGRHFVPLVKPIDARSGAKARLERAIIDAYELWEQQQVVAQAADPVCTYDTHVAIVRETPHALNCDRCGTNLIAFRAAYA